MAQKHLYEGFLMDDSTVFEACSHAIGFFCRATKEEMSRDIFA
jgi:hypothetical protein